MDIDQKKDLIVFALVIALAFLIGRNAIYQGALNKIASIESEIKAEEEKSDILGAIGILDRRLKAVGERSFSTTEITYFLDKVSELATASGIEIETFDPLPAVDTERYIETPLKLPLRCEYHQLGRFLALMEGSQEFIWVKGVDMQKSTVTDPREDMTPKVNLAVSGLYLKK